MLMKIEGTGSGSSFRRPGSKSADVMIERYCDDKTDDGSGG